MRKYVPHNVPKITYYVVSDLLKVKVIEAKKMT